MNEIATDLPTDRMNERTPSKKQSEQSTIEEITGSSYQNSKSLLSDCYYRGDHLKGDSSDETMDWEVLTNSNSEHSDQDNLDLSSSTSDVVDQDDEKEPIFLILSDMASAEAETETGAENGDIDKKEQAMSTIADAAAAAVVEEMVSIAVTTLTIHSMNDDTVMMTHDIVSSESTTSPSNNTDDAPQVLHGLSYNRRRHCSLHHFVCSVTNLWKEQPTVFTGIAAILTALWLAQVYMYVGQSFGNSMVNENDNFERSVIMHLRHQMAAMESEVRFQRDLLRERFTEGEQFRGVIEELQTELDELKAIVLMTQHHVDHTEKSIRHQLRKAINHFASSGSMELAAVEKKLRSEISSILVRARVTTGVGVKDEELVTKDNELGGKYLAVIHSLLMNGEDTLIAANIKSDQTANQLAAVRRELAVVSTIANNGLVVATQAADTARMAAATADEVACKSKTFRKEMSAMLAVQSDARTDGTMNHNRVPYRMKKINYNDMSQYKSMVDEAIKNEMAVRNEVSRVSKRTKLEISALVEAASMYLNDSANRRDNKCTTSKSHNQMDKHLRRKCVSDSHHRSNIDYSWLIAANKSEKIANQLAIIFQEFVGFVVVDDVAIKGAAIAYDFAKNIRKEISAMLATRCNAPSDEIMNRYHVNFTLQIRKLNKLLSLYWRMFDKSTKYTIATEVFKNRFGGSKRTKREIFTSVEVASAYLDTLESSLKIRSRLVAEHRKGKHDSDSHYRHNIDESWFHNYGSHSEVIERHCKRDMEGHFFNSSRIEGSETRVKNCLNSKRCHILENVQKRNMTSHYFAART